MADIRRRRTARLLILDSSRSVLLVRYAEHRAGRGSSYWATPGGGIEEGETPLEAAARELREETGLSASIGEALFSRVTEFELPSGWVAQEEEFFVVRVSAAAPSVHNTSAEPILEHRWWSVQELRATDATIYPEELVERLARLSSAA